MMTSMRRFPTTVLLLSVALVTSCSTSRAGGQPPDTMDWCEEGQGVLVVRNELGHDIEIIETRRGPAARVIVAVLPQGYHEVEIRTEPGYSYSARALGDRRIVATQFRRSAGDSVILSRECRER